MKIKYSGEMFGRFDSDFFSVDNLLRLICLIGMFIFGYFGFHMAKTGVQSLDSLVPLHGARSVVAAPSITATAITVASGLGFIIPLGIAQQLNLWHPKVTILNGEAMTVHDWIMAAHKFLFMENLKYFIQHIKRSKKKLNQMQVINSG